MFIGTAKEGKEKVKTLTHCRMVFIPTFWALQCILLPGMSVKQEKLKLISFVQQLQNQEMLRAMVKQAELEINGKVIETVKRLEDPVQRQRNLVEQERQKYLGEEEKIVKKLWWVEKPLQIYCFSLSFSSIK